MKQKRALKIILIFLIILKIQTVQVFADVGDFESYSSDSSWSSSSSDGGSYSSWDDDDYYRGNSSGDYVLGLIFFIIVIVMLLRSKWKDNHMNNPMANERKQDELEIINKIKEKDENFNADEFKSWVRDLYIKLQYAWSDRNWETIRCFETNELYEQHSTQLQRYIQNKQINKMERVSVNWVKLLNFEQSGDKDVLSIVLNSKMIDYIINEETEEVIKGDKETQRINNYKLTFIRKTGVKTKPGTNKLNVTNCPNCGAPTEITSAGKCSYCGSVITTGEHNWVLSNLERYTNI